MGGGDGTENFVGQSAAVPISHQASKKVEVVDDYEWPFELSIDVTKSGQARIAFLSGQERKYYPENPGHSKLGVMFALNSHKGDTPNPSYICPRIGVSKPISTKGYGIGGLSAPRFPSNLKSLQEKRPEPGTYQKIHMYPARPKLNDKSNPEVRRQYYVGFGSYLSVPRFGPVESAPVPGPGAYNFGAKEPNRIKAKESFGGRKCIIPTVGTICRYTDGEPCSECGEPQNYDYYRTKRPILHPTAKRADQAIYIALCRKCYCKLWHEDKTSTGDYIRKHDTRLWTRPKLLNLCHKVRNCNFKHEHQGLPNKITKSTKHDIARLTRKEILLAKYYGDTCTQIKPNVVSIDNAPETLDITPEETDAEEEEVEKNEEIETGPNTQ